MRRLMAAANWKMNGNRTLVKDFAGATWPQDKLDIVFGLPATLLPIAQQDGLNMLAGEDVSAHESGAHTGECSATMLEESGCSYCIIGHSERRSDHGENEELLMQKWRQLKNSGLKVIYCIGESQDAHDSEQTAQVLAAQLQPILDADLIDADTVIAYEPIWAIGSGKAATPAYAEQTHREIRRIIGAKNAKIASSLRILYGGSVKPNNAGELIAAENIDGFLVGGASLNVQSFTGIIEAML